jgi:hypothetical protein
LGIYLLLYRGKPLPQDNIARQRYVADWTKWTREVGNSMLAGRPMAKAVTVTPGQVAELKGEPVSTYSIIEAKDMDEAIELSRGIPDIMDDGRVDVYQMYDVN